MAAIPGIMVDIGANVARMQADMRKLTGTMESGFGKIRSAAMSLAGAVAGAFAFREIIRFGEQALQTGDRLAKLSQSAGVSVESLSALKYAADLADVDLDSLAKSLGILSRNLFDAQAGTGEAKDAIKALGITITDTRGNLLAGDKVMAQVADKFAAMEDGSAKTAIALKIFGRSGGQLIPLLNQGSAALAEMRDEAEKLGLVMSTETAQQMERVNDNFTRLKAAAQGAGIRIMTDLLPTLENLTNIFVEVAKEGESLEGISYALTLGLKSLGSVALVTYASFQDLEGGIAGFMATVDAVVHGNFVGAMEIMKQSAKDSDEIWKKTFERLDRIWLTGAASAVANGQKIKKALGAGPTLAGAEDQGIQKRLQALFEESEALQMGADALLLYEKGLHGASQEQKEYGLYLLRLIEAHKQEKDALLQRINAEEEDEKQIRQSEMAIFNMIDALKMQAITADMSEEEIFELQLTLKGASKTIQENADAYFAAIRSAREYKDEIELLKGMIEETKTSMDKYEERMGEVQGLLDKGMISPEIALRAQAIAWERMVGGEKDNVAERDQILLDFADRVRAQNRFTADYAIEQINRQAAIFKVAGADEVAVAIWAAKEKQKASHEWQDGAIRGLQDYEAEAGNMAKGIESAISGNFRNMEDALIDFVKTGKLNFKSLVDSIIADLLRIAIRKMITAPLASGLGSLIGAFFAGGSGGGGVPVGSYGGPESAYGIMHRGGITGISSGLSKSLPAVYLAAAPRYHAGLQPDEFPTILKRGEGVFTPEQMQAIGSQTNISITIPVTAGAMDTRQAGRMRRDLEGELEPVVRRIVERYV
jgi:hypothetical protein